MKSIVVFALAAVTLGISIAALGQSRIEAAAELKIKGETAFPFKENQMTGFKWKYGTGGELFSRVVRNQELDFLCDYSCTMTAEIAEDAFYFWETRGESTEHEHDVYLADVIVTIKQQGKFHEFSPIACSNHEEFDLPLTIEVLDFIGEGLIDHALVHGEFNPWPVGPCWVDPMFVKMKP